MDFTAFFESEFYKKACYQLDYDGNGHVAADRKPHCIFTTNMINNNLITSLLEDSDSYDRIFLELYNFLYHVSLDSEYKNLIINQWTEVLYHLNLKDTNLNKGWMSKLFILPKQTVIPPHRHSLTKNKHTVSFMYHYNYSEKNDSTVTVSDTVYHIPCKEKVLLNMNDNPNHSAYLNSEITFAWVNEFNDYIEISDETIKTFTVIGDKLL